MYDACARCEQVQDGGSLKESEIPVLLSSVKRDGSEKLRRVSREFHILLDMPNTVEGLLFGDFTTDEWAKYFRETARGIGIRPPPVEFYFDFELSEPEEQVSGSSKSGGACDSSVAESPCSGGPTLPEDSGVEVGQESEQEVTSSLNPGAAVGDSSNQKQGAVTEGLSFFTSAKRPSHDGKEISSAAAARGSTAQAPNQPEAGSEKAEGEKSRRRRRRRRPRHRSGSVSSSTSESDERLNNRLKASTPHSTLEAHKNQEASVTKHENSKVAESGRKRSDSGSGKNKPTVRKSHSSDSPSQSDTDLRSNKNVSNKSESHVGLTGESNNEKQQAIATDSDVKAIVDSKNTGTENSDQNKSPPPKPAAVASWASLFKGTSTANSALAYKVSAPSQPNAEVVHAAIKKPVEENVQPAVSVEEDKHARKLAESLQKVKLNFESKGTYLRGLVNRANWCYINAVFLFQKAAHKTAKTKKTKCKIKRKSKSRILKKVMGFFSLVALFDSDLEIICHGYFAEWFITLQALLACPPFFNMLKQIQPIKDRGQTSTPILDSMVTFMHEFEVIPKQAAQSTTKNNKQDFKVGMAFEPTYVYRMLNQIKSSLSVRGRQEDAEEFLSCVLNGLHDELLQLDALVKPQLQAAADTQPVDNPESGITEGKEQDDEGDWEQVGPKNKSSITRMASLPQSFVSDIFGGYLRSSLHQTGLKESANVEPFFDLQLDIQNVTSIEDALSHLTVKEEVQGYTCSRTKLQVDASRRLTFERLPKILVLHLKRFLYLKTGSQKLQKAVDYPLELNMSKDLLSPNVKSKYPQAQRNYRLFAVVYHHGKSASGGHYTADVHHPTMGWVRADDTKLKTVPLNFVLKPVQGKDPYLLYYRRTDLMP